MDSLELTNLMRMSTSHTKLSLKRKFHNKLNRAVRVKRMKMRRRKRHV
jgi:hypothetical protein